jgi:RNA polymerase sigma factor (sigma-70 family)
MTVVGEAAYYRRAREWARRAGQIMHLDADHAEDCAQQFVVKLASKPTTPPRWTWPAECVDAYLRAAARNHLYNYLESMRVEAAHVCNAGLEPAAYCCLEASHWLPEMEALRAVFWDKVSVCRSALTAEQDALLGAHQFDGATIGDLAAAQDCSADTIRHRLRRIYSRLAATLREKGDTETELRSCLVPTSTPARRRERC